VRSLSTECKFTRTITLRQENLTLQEDQHPPSLPQSFNFRGHRLSHLLERVTVRHDEQHPLHGVNRAIESPSKTTCQRRLRGSISLPVRRFHVLLNSHFKVLFNFRSRYLFAIGLTVIFSLTRTIPGALCSRVEEHDSIIVKWARTHSKPVTYGTFTLYGTLIGGHPPPRKTAALPPLMQHSRRPSHRPFTLPEENAKI
jgi:hypothetical protein